MSSANEVNRSTIKHILNIIQCVIQTDLRNSWAMYFIKYYFSLCILPTKRKRNAEQNE